MAANAIGSPSLVHALAVDPRPSILFRRNSDGTLSDHPHKNGAFLQAQVRKHLPDDFESLARSAITPKVRSPASLTIAGSPILVIPIATDYLLCSSSEVLQLPTLDDVLTTTRSSESIDTITDITLTRPRSFEDGSEPWSAPAKALGWLNYATTLTAHQKRIASFPWHKTSLGPIISWPAALKLAVAAHMLDPEPRCIYWGPEFVAIYNEACIPLFGGKHPYALGAHPKDVWAESWPIAAHMFNDAMYHGKATQVTNLQMFVCRHGFLEEVFVNSIYLPIPGFDSTAADDNGLLNEFTETTDSVLAARHQKVVNGILTHMEEAQSIRQFFDATVETMRKSVSDVAYALVYLRNDLIAHQTNGEMCAESGFRLTHNLGLEGVLPDVETAFDFDGPGRARQGQLTSTLLDASEQDGVLVLRSTDGTLPPLLMHANPDRGFGDVVTDALVLSITTLTGREHVASLVIGMNPRRSMDARQMTWAQVLRDALIKGITMVSLPNDARRNQRRIEQINISLLDRLKESDAESNRLQARFTKMAGSAPHGMFMFTADGRKPLYVNDEYLRLLSITREALDDERAFLQSIADEDVMRVAEAFQKLITDYKSVSIKFRAKEDWEVLDETTGRRISAPRYLVATCLPEMDELGNVLNLQGWLQDVSEAHYTQSLMSQRLQEATVSRQNAESFIDMVSHELRNPLSAILQSADSITSAQSNFIGSVDDGDELTAQRETAESVLDAAQTIILCAQHQKRIGEYLRKADSGSMILTENSR